MDRTALAVVLGATVILLAPGPRASAQTAPESPPPAPIDSEADALDALVEAEAAFTESDPQLADPTEELRDLIVAIPHLEGADRRRARALIARPPATGPDAGGTEPFGGEWLKAGGAPADEDPDSPVCDADFCVHWTDEGPDAPQGAQGPLIPEYVEDVLERAQQSQDVQNEALGWPDPKSDGLKGQGPSGESGPAKTDIYLSDICSPTVCVFGYAGPDDTSAECETPPFKCAAFLVLDNDYGFEEFGYGTPEDPDFDTPLSVTMAHEYNHVLQFAIDALQDAWMFESTAVWAEEQVFPDLNDWLFYMTPWAHNPQQPITKASAGGGLRIYGSGVWNHWLDDGAAYGPDVVLDSWNRSRQSRPKDFAVGAYNLGIRDSGGMGFSQEFARFASATAEWRVNDDNFPDEDLLPDVDRNGKLRPGGRPQKFKLDHTAFRLLRIKPGSADRVRLRVRVRRGVRTGIALVGRDGTRFGGVITEKLAYLPRGGRASIALPAVQTFERITAVIANADGRTSGFGAGDWRYTRDNEAYRVALGGS